MSVYEDFLKEIGAKADVSHLPKEYADLIKEGLYHGAQLYKHNHDTTKSLPELAIQALHEGSQYFTGCTCFGVEEYQLIVSGILEGIDVEIYAKPVFSASQMLQLYRALINKVDPTPYALPEYSYTNMSLYTECLQRHYDITPFLNPDYTYIHLDTICDCLKYGCTDISCLCNPSLQYDEVIKIHAKLFGYG